MYLIANILNYAELVSVIDEFIESSIIKGIDISIDSEVSDEDAMKVLHLLEEKGYYMDDKAYTKEEYLLDLKDAIIEVQDKIIMRERDEEEEKFVKNSIIGKTFKRILKNIGEVELIHINSYYRFDGKTCLVYCLNGKRIVISTSNGTRYKSISLENAEETGSILNTVYQYYPEYRCFKLSDDVVELPLIGKEEFDTIFHNLIETKFDEFNDLISGL